MPVGTVAEIVVALVTANVVATKPLNFTEVASVKFVPVIVIDCPTDIGSVNDDVIVGGGTTV